MSIIIKSDVKTNLIGLMNVKRASKEVAQEQKSNRIVITKKNSSSVRIDSPICNTEYQIIHSQTINLGAREIVAKEVPYFSTFDALMDNIMHEINSS